MTPDPHAHPAPSRLVPPDSARRDLALVALSAVVLIVVRLAAGWLPVAG